MDLYGALETGSLMKILLVDDEKSMRLLLDGFLRQCGYTDILSAPSAHKAYETLSEIADSPDADEVDLILMDINMPGINGIEACRHIKADLGHPDIQVIMVTGVDDVNTLAEAFNVGAMDYIKKPIVTEDLRARVQSALAMKQLIDFQKNTIAELTEKKDELSRALQDVKVLQGMLPICSTCKKIRNDSGSWDVMEAYISAHSDATFSHGICPVCVNKEFPDVYEKIKTRLSKQR